MARRPLKDDKFVSPVTGMATGRPRKQPPADAVQVIQQATAKGATKKGTAIALGVSDETLQRWLTEFPELQEAFDKGKERERQTLHDVLYETATKGTGNHSLIAAMFLLKSRHGYREGEQEQQANRVNVTFNIPAAQPLDKFMVIDDGNNRAESLPAKLTRTS